MRFHVCLERFGGVLGPSRARWVNNRVSKNTFLKSERAERA